MVTKWAVIEEIDGKRTVMNIAKASPEIAQQRGYLPYDDHEIGMVEEDGKFKKPKRKREKVRGAKLLELLDEAETDALIDFLKSGNVLSLEKAERLKGK